MINELIFFSHISILFLSLLGALRIGKEALIGLICVLVVLMNMFVLKQINLFGLSVTATDAFAVAVTLGLNMLQEYYGLKLTQKTIWISFYVSIVVLVLSKVHLLYIPSNFDTYQPHFVAILTIMPRIVLASLITYLIVMQADALLYNWFKQRMSDYVVLRNYISISISQFLDTILFSVLGLWGVVPSLTHIILFSYSIKVITIICAGPTIALAKRYIKAA